MEIFLKSTVLFQHYSLFASKAHHKEFFILLLRLSCFYLEKCWPFLFLQLQETSIAAFTLLCLLFPSWWLTWHKQQISYAASLRKTNKQQTESKKNFGKISRETMCYAWARHSPCPLTQNLLQNFLNSFKFTRSNGAEQVIPECSIAGKGNCGESRRKREAELCRKIWLDGPFFPFHRSSGASSKFSSGRKSFFYCLCPSELTLSSSWDSALTAFSSPLVLGISACCLFGSSSTCIRTPSPEPLTQQGGSVHWGLCPSPSSLPCLLS